MIRYELILSWSEIDRAFIAEVPELPGCAADGATYQEAVQNAEVIIQEWIETARELKRPIPEPKGRLRVYEILRGMFVLQQNCCRYIKGFQPRLRL